MYIKARNLLTAFTAILSISATDSYATAVHSLTITGWDWQVAGSITPSWSVQQTNMQVVMGQYQGIPDAINTLDSGILGGVGTALGTAFELGIMTANGSDYGFSTTAAPSGDVTNGILSLDLQSWMIFFVNADDPLRSMQIEAAGSYPVNSVSTPVVTTFDPATRFFTAYWEYWDFRDFGGVGAHVFDWNIEGYVTLVPVPPGLVLFGSGLLALIGIARRKKAA